MSYLQRSTTQADARSQEIDCTVSIQVVNYNTKVHLETCLQSLTASLADAELSYRLLVLDNGSDDDLSELEAEYGDSAEFFSTPMNHGFGGGHNELATRSDSLFMCFVNPDVIVTQPQVFTKLLSLFEDPKVAAAGPLLRTTTGDVQMWDHGELRGVRAFVANHAGHAHWRPRSKAIEAAWVSGAFMIVRRSAFDAAGGFDGGYFLYKEEEDLCLQMRRAGEKIIYEPTVEVEHVGSVVAHRDPKHFQFSIERYTEKNFPAKWRRAIFDALFRHVTRRL